MEQIRRIGRIGQMGLIGLVSFFLLCRVVQADGLPISLRVAPLYFDLEINPGEEKSGSLYIENASDQDYQIQAEYSDFFIDDAGKYIFSEGRTVSDDKLKPYIMSKWLSVSEEKFALRKGESKIVDYKVKVPQDANLGGRYGAIFLRTVCDPEKDKAVVYTDKSNVCVSGRVGVLMLVQVGGEAVKKGEIRKLVLPAISFNDKSKLSLEIANIGNSHFKPQGEVTAKNIFGQEISRMEIKDKTLLPTTSYTFSGEINRKDVFGIYRVSGDIRDGEGGNMRFSKYLFLIPWKEILLILVLVGAWVWFLKKYKISFRNREKSLGRGTSKSEK